MTKLFATIIKWLATSFGSFLLILSVLVAGVYLQSGWDEFKSIKGKIPSIQARIEAYRNEISRVDAAIAGRQAEWDAKRAADEQQLGQELASIDSKIRSAGATIKQDLQNFSALQEAASRSRIAANNARKRYQQLERASHWWDPYIDQKKAFELKEAQAIAATAENVARNAEAARDAMTPKLKNVTVAPLLTQKAAKLKQIEDVKTAVSREVEELKQSKEQMASELRRTEGDLNQLLETVASDPRQKLLAVVGDQWKTAVGILVGLMLTPIAIKAALFYLLAPIAAKLRPIRVLPNDQALGIPEPRESSVSIPIDVGANEEILVHSDFLQSSSLPARKHTQWFLNPKIPFSSIASGMFAMTRITPAGDGSTRVVVSSQNDAFGEVGLIEIPPGGAMVIQPRSLAGVVKPRGVPVQITRHWRLISLHAWLTLQLRYLVIHGPCELILKGCRGIRAESPNAAAPRIINQSATIGFSANLAYSNTRCETFASYLMGKEDLFNDLFAGGPGRFVYEELPSGGRKGGIMGRGLEGFVDASLKVFGL